MIIDEVTVFGPASVANVACAFDVLGFAIEGWGDVVTAKRSKVPGVSITAINSPFGELPVDLKKNTASVSASALLEDKKMPFGVALSIEKKMPIGSGLGSSAASAAAAVFATNLLLDSPLLTRELIPYAMEGERAAAGVAHADNVSPALLGGITLVRDSKDLDVVQVPVPKNLWVSIVCPLIEVKTEDARKVLKKTIPLSTAVEQFGNIAGLVAGLCTNDLPLVGRSLKDVIIEPERAVLIPGFYRVKEAALQAGALGCSISGSGPSLFAFSESEFIAKKVSGAMELRFKEQEIDAITCTSTISKTGCRQIHGN